MEIDITRYKNLGHDVIFKTSSGVLLEEGVSDEQLDELAVNFLFDTVLHDVDYFDIVQKLIDADVLDEQMISSFIADKEIGDE